MGKRGGWILFLINTNDYKCFQFVFAVVLISEHKLTCWARSLARCDLSEGQWTQHISGAGLGSSGIFCWTSPQSWSHSCVGHVTLQGGLPPAGPLWPGRPAEASLVPEKLLVMKMKSPVCIMHECFVLHPSADELLLQVSALFPSCCSSWRAASMFNAGL